MAPVLLGTGQVERRAKYMNGIASFEEQLFALNMTHCEQFRPSLFRLLSETENTERYWMFPSDHESRVNNLIDTQHDLLFYEQSNPIGSMAEHVETCIHKLQGIMICLGFGLGYGTLMLVQQKNYVSRSIIVIEPDPEALLLAFRSLDCREIIECADVLMLVGMESDELSSAISGHILDQNRIINARNVQIIDLPASVNADPEYYDRAIQSAKSAILEGVKIVGNCPNDALQGLDTTLANIPLHSRLPGVEELRHLFKGKPGIVVSSGPSLDKNIHLLEAVKDQCVIVGADASLRHLVKARAAPDFITSVERIEATAKLLQNIDPESYQDTFLVGSPVCHPDTFLLFTRRSSLVTESTVSSTY